MTEDRVRVLRVLEYEGPRSWVEYSMRNRSVKGEVSPHGSSIIREATVGEATVVPSLGVNSKTPTAPDREYRTPTAPDREYRPAVKMTGSVTMPPADHDREVTFSINKAPPPMRVYHYSDCPMHNEPAKPVGPCDCDKPGRMVKVDDAFAAAKFVFRKLKYSDSYATMKDASGVLPVTIDQKTAFSIASKHGASEVLFQ